MTRMTRPDCAVMCNLINIHTHTHTARHVEEVRLRRLHCVRFLLFQPRLIRQTYTERRRLAPEYMRSNTHTHQRTQLTIVTIIIEREFVATAIIILYFLLLPCLMMYYIVSVLFLLFVWCPCMATTVYNGRLLPDIIMLAQCYYYRNSGTRLNVMKRFCLCSL